MRRATVARDAARRRSAAALVGAVVFLLLAGTGAASANWTTASSSLTASATAATLTVTQSGVGNLAKSYAPSDTVTFAPVTVSNSGTAPASYTLAIKAQNGNNLSNAIVVTAWMVGSASQCSATAPSSGTATATLTNGITAPTMNLAAGANAFFCLRTSITEDQAKRPGGDPAVAIVTLNASIGSWTSNSTSSVSQTIAADTVAPTVPANLAASAIGARQLTLNWSASTDAYGVTGYRIYRAGVAIATVTGTSFTDTGLTPTTQYRYTVRAYDAAGNESADSNTVTTTTAAVRYRITNPHSGLCIDADSSSTANGTKLIIWDCASPSPANQIWRMLPTSDGFVRILPNYSDTLVWDIDNAGSGRGGADGDKAQLWSWGNTTNQQWRLENISNSANPNTFQFVNRNSGKCLDVPNAGRTAGTQLQQYTCNQTVAQRWTLTEVN